MVIDKNILINNLEGHEDAVWGISVHHNRSELLSCSADGSVKLWSPTNLKAPCLSSYVSDQGIVINFTIIVWTINKPQFILQMKFLLQLIMSET